MTTKTVITRTPGPETPGGFQTLSGMADGRRVHWIIGGAGSSRADKLEAQYSAASQLSRLMILNAYTLEGLNAEEMQLATQLIATCAEADETCWLCEKKLKARRNKAVADTGLCRGHNRYALLRRI